MMSQVSAYTGHAALRDEGGNGCSPSLPVLATCRGPRGCLPGLPSQASCAAASCSCTSRRQCECCGQHPNPHSSHPFPRRQLPAPSPSPRAPACRSSPSATIAAPPLSDAIIRELHHTFQPFWLHPAGVCTFSHLPAASWWTAATCCCSQSRAPRGGSSWCRCRRHSTSW